MDTFNPFLPKYLVRTASLWTELITGQHDSPVDHINLEFSGEINYRLYKTV